MGTNNIFLESIANYYYDILKTDSSSICFVFPSRRAGLFFTDYLKKLADRPIFSPKILTISDLFDRESGLITADQITLLFTLHKIYQQVTGDTKPFDEFMNWGEMILADFDDIDKYMVDARDIFRNLVDYKMLDDDYSHLSENQRRAIESFWGTFHLGKISEHQQVFLDIWTKMYDVYTQFRQTLREQNIGYTGMIYREIAGKIKETAIFDNGTQKYAFIGFNALTESEHILLRHLQKQNRAQFFWDYSRLILPSDTGSTPSSGPGMFLFENTMRYPKPKDWDMPVNNSLPELTITAVAHPMEQNAEVTRFLKEEYADDNKSAVILTDENMLIPVLYALPDNVERANITMGYPLKNSPAYGLVDLIYMLQKNSRSSASGTWFYHRNVMAILQHPYVAACADSESTSIREEMLKHNMIYVPSASLQKQRLLTAIFRHAGNDTSLTGYFSAIISIIFEKLSGREDDEIQCEFINALYNALNRFDDLLNKNSNTAISSETWFKLFRSIAEVQTVAFKGEPLAGLQIMGILETRAIDFERLIILDMNEGIFPKTNAANTFIPYGLRVGFGLPTIEFQDSIFAYYFYRLIHRAKKVELLYSTSASGEMSRYLFQLIYQFNAHPKMRTSVLPVNLLRMPPIVVKKDKKVIDILNRYSKEGDKFLSPSALSQYIECPVKFYYEKIANIKESDEVTEEADARVFGKIFHDVLEKYYIPYKGKVINPELLDGWINDTGTLENNIKSSFLNQLGLQAGTNLQGKNMIIYEVIKNYILQFFKTEKTITPFTFIDAEYELKQNFITQAGLEINAGGYIDRIHRKDNTTNIIDYKTGSGSDTINSIPQLFESNEHSKNKPLFQTMMYCLLLDQSNNDKGQLQPGVVYMKKLFDKEFTTKLTIGLPRKPKETLVFNDYREEFYRELSNTIDSLFNPEIDFTQTANSDMCKYCTFKDLCGR